MGTDVERNTREFNPILRTKLHRPQLTAGLIDRVRLITVMNRAHEVPLTLVSAPAGYGKSVLVAQWAEQRDSPVAWLSLDASDSEPTAFLQYFLAAVDTVAPGACDATNELLEARSQVPIPMLAGCLLNDLDAIDVPSAIVLDDYHRIDSLSRVHDLMLRLFEHPPRQFRFVVLTRQDPPFDLLRLRAGDRINEVRLQDLRFTAHETHEFMSTTEDLSLSNEAQTHLEHEVEGWAVGLRLVSMALQQVGDADRFLKRLPKRLPEIQEYLFREVLAAHPVGFRVFLLASAVFDRFCAEGLDAICEPLDTDDQPGFTSADFMKELRTGNLFTVSLDARREWYRHHHLFQLLLVSELERLHGPDYVAALHLRASQWFEGEGLIDEALKHALAAEDMERAVGLVTRHRHEALDADQWYVLARWLSLIPNEAVQQCAELLLARAWISLNCLFQVEPVPALLDRAESMLVDEPGMESLRGELALCRGYILWLMGDGAQSLKHMTVALERIPASHVDVRSNAEIVYAVSKHMIGKKEQAIRYLNDLLANPDSSQATRRSRLLFARVFIYVMAGELTAAELAHRQLREFDGRDESAYTQAWTDYMQGVIHLNRCEWDAAIEYLERTVGRRYIHHTRAAMDSLVGLVLAYHAVGREDDARETMRTFREYVTSRNDPSVEGLMLSAEARFTILQGQPEQARGWLDSHEPPPEGFSFWWTDIPSITRCLVTIAVGSPDSIAQAEARLRESVRVNEAAHNTIQLIKVLSLLAMACVKQGKTEEALGFLERSVTMARRGKLIFPFVELGTPMVGLLGQLDGEREFTAEVERLVATFGAPTDGSAMPEAETGKPLQEGHERLRVDLARKLEDLTNRELDVLELLALRLQNKEIAARLGISSQTVGGHLKQIYRKLGVRGRRKAVERASDRGILDRRPPV